MNWPEFIRDEGPARGREDRRGVRVVEERDAVAVAEAPGVRAEARPRPLLSSALTILEVEWWLYLLSFLF